MTERRTSSTLASHENELEVALFGFAQQQHPVLSVEIYLDIERKKDYVLLADSVSEVNMSLEESQDENSPEGSPKPESKTKKPVKEPL